MAKRLSKAEEEARILEAIMERQHDPILRRPEPEPEDDDSDMKCATCREWNCRCSSIHY